MSREQIVEAVITYSKLGFQMSMHANGDAAIDNVIDAVVEARKQGVEVIRPRIEHCSIVQNDQLISLKEHDISGSFLIGHVYYWGSAFRDNIFGEKKAIKLDRCGSFERMGIPFSLHSDAPVIEISPLEMVEIAVTRRTWADPNYVLGPKECASVEAALRGVTSVPAWQLMSEHEVGSLEGGKFADFVILADDPRKVKPETIGEIKVVETWIDGRKVYANSESEK